MAINEGLKDDVPQRVLAKGRKSVGYFSHSALTGGFLHKIQESLNHKKCSLILDMTTQWNSPFLMLEWLTEE